MTASTRQTNRPWLSAGLDDADRTALAHACADTRQVSAGTELQRQDARGHELHILIEGWAARCKILEEGSRFIAALAVPGDICEFDALRFDRLDYGVTMITAGTVAVLPRERVDALFTAHPAVAKAFWLLALAENSILMERAASMGRRFASQRVAHLLCELLIRLIIVGKAEGLSYDLPLTQEHIADALGLTPVHINRTLQTLRSMRLVTVQHRRVRIHDWTALAALCGFCSSHLHLETVDDTFMHKLPTVEEREIIKHDPAFPAHI